MIEHGVPDEGKIQALKSMATHTQNPFVQIAACQLFKGALAKPSEADMVFLCSISSLAYPESAISA